MIKIDNAEIFGKVIADAVVTVDSNSNLQTWEKTRAVNAIAKAANRLQDNQYAPFMDFNGDADELLIWNPVTNQIYTVTASYCHCAAASNGNYCWHRAAKRIYEIYLPLALADAFKKKELIAANRRGFEAAGLLESVVYDEVQIMEVGA